MRRSACMWIARICLVTMLIALFSTTLTTAWLDFKWLMYKHADKVAHLLGMLFITSASLVAFPTARAVWVIVGAVALASIIEIAQLFGPRSADIDDISASFAGILISSLAFYAAEIRKWMQGKPR